MDKRTRCGLRSSIAAILFCATRGASAEVTVSGAVLPDNPSDPWVIPGVLQVGYFPGDPGVSTGEVLISKGGTLVSNGAAVAAGNGLDLDFHGTVWVTDYGSTWTNHGEIAIGARGFNIGTVSVSHGARVTTDDISVGARGTYACGTLLVDGYDAAVTTTGTAVIGHSECTDLVELTQGASFFTNNVRVTTCSDCFGKVLATGYATRWIATGNFIVGAVGRGEVELGYQAKLSTINAKIASGDGPSLSRAGRVNVGGYGATWSNQGLLRVGAHDNGRIAPGTGLLAIGVDGTVDTEDTEIDSDIGSAAVQVVGDQASWSNSGDVLIRATAPLAPSLLIDAGGQIRIGGALTIERWILGAGTWYEAPVARLVSGSLSAATIEAEAGDFEFAGGRLETGAFLGDLDNTQSGVLVVGRAYASSSVIGDYTQGASAKLNLTARGPSALPLLRIEGSATLEGRLNVHAAAGTAPFRKGDTVTLLAWNGALTGHFATIHIALPLKSGLAWDTSALYTTGVIQAVAAH